MTAGTTKAFVRVLLLDTDGGAGAVAAARNLTLPRSSPRLAEAGVHSAGRRGEQGLVCEEMNEERLMALKEQLKGLYPRREQLNQEGKLEGERGGEQEQEQEMTKDIWQETIQAVETVLSSSHPPALIPTANSFLQTVLALLARVLQTDRAIEEAPLRLLQKLFFVDG